VSRGRFAVDVLAGWLLALGTVYAAHTLLPAAFDVDDLGQRLTGCPTRGDGVSAALAAAGLGPDARSPIAGCASAASLVLPRVPWSLLPFLIACAITVPLASAFGAVGAARRGSLVDLALTAFVILLHAVPGVAVALFVQSGVRALGLPGVGAGTLGGRGAGASLVGPTLTLTCGLLPGLTRLARAGWREALGQGWWSTARDEGRATFALALRFGTPIALHAPIQQLAWAAPRWIVGAAVVETVFGWPGVGGLLAKHAAAGDGPVVAFGVTLAAAIALTIGLVSPPPAGRR
jgi:peptide/nickel transport system permease protein